MLTDGKLQIGGVVGAQRVTPGEPQRTRERFCRTHRVDADGEVFEVGKDLSHARMVLKMLDAHVANHLSPLVTPARRVYLTRGHGERSSLGDVEESRGRKLVDFERLPAGTPFRMALLALDVGGNAASATVDARVQ